MTKSDKHAEPEAASIRALIGSALSPTATEGDLEALRDRRGAAWRCLDHIDEIEAQSLWDGADTARLVAFYAALGEGLASPDTEASPSLVPFLAARDDEERSIGEAFAQALIVNLPEWLTAFDRLFAAAPILEPEVYDVVSLDASVEAAGAAAAGLARFGITPVTIAETARALSNLAEQVGREIGIGIGDHILLAGVDEKTADFSASVITRAMALDEIAMSFDLPGETVAPLLDWIIEVAARKPLLFDGYRTTPRGRDLLLCRTGVTENDLFKRWRSDESVAPAPSIPQRRTAAAA